MPRELQTIRGFPISRRLRGNDDDSSCSTRFGITCSATEPTIPGPDSRVKPFLAGGNRGLGHFPGARRFLHLQWIGCNARMHLGPGASSGRSVATDSAPGPCYRLTSFETQLALPRVSKTTAQSPQTTKQITNEVTRLNSSLPSQRHTPNLMSPALTSDRFGWKRNVCF
jgi:hypothetical protein